MFDRFIVHLSRQLSVQYENRMRQHSKKQREMCKGEDIGW